MYKGKKLNGLLVIKVLIVLILINYMIVTIIMNDFVLAKFFRDVLLIVLLWWCLKDNKLILPIKFKIMMLFCILLVSIAIFSDSKYLAIQETRKIVFPIVFFVLSISYIRYENLYQICKFILRFVTIFSAWGIFQALILTDKFLMNLGYPLRYAYEYGRMSLYASYYFGNMGIQRVVSTLSSSNVCALILGFTLIFMIMNYDIIRNIKYKNISLIIIAAGYLLTFSRSNFLAAAVVIIFIIWKEIPHKEKLIAAIVVLCMLLLIVGIVQGESGILYKLLDWVNQSLHFSDSSSSGRFIIWETAFNAVSQNPLGIGLGHVGDNSYLAGSDLTYACENSFFAIALDTGWLGVILYYGYLFLLFKHLWFAYKKYKEIEYKNRANSCKAGTVLIIYVLISMCFSNYVLDMEAMALFYFYLALSYVATYNETDVFANSNVDISEKYY